jgi:uncharacterized membrane protein
VEEEKSVVTGKKAASFWRRFIDKFKAVVIAGLVVTVPIGITIWIFIWLFSEIDKLLRPYVTKIFGHEIVGVGFAVIVALVLIIGLIATNVIGKRIVHWSENMLSKVPITRTIYVALKQIAQSVSDPQQNRFRQVVLIEFPAKGMKTVAFITNEETDKNGKKFFNVFIPTALNPTGGFIEIVREEDIIRTDLSIEEGLKLAVSAGSMSPDGLKDCMGKANLHETSQEQKQTLK